MSTLPAPVVQGCQSIDAGLLRTGLRTGQVLEICGESGEGKDGEEESSQMGVLCLEGAAAPPPPPPPAAE